MGGTPQTFKERGLFEEKDIPTCPWSDHKISLGDQQLFGPQPGPQILRGKPPNPKGEKNGKHHQRREQKQEGKIPFPAPEKENPTPRPQMGSGPLKFPGN